MSFLDSDDPFGEDIVFEDEFTDDFKSDPPPPKATKKDKKQTRTNALAKRLAEVKASKQRYMAMG